MRLPDPVLPPLLAGHPVDAPDRPRPVAACGAAAGTLGAGDLVWARDAARFECALVLEPDVPAGRAAEMLPLALVALGDCLSSLAPPQAAVTFRWPDRVCVNGGVAGRVAAVMAATDPGAPPPWMVICAEAAIAHDMRTGEPGEHPDATALEEEGFEDANRTVLLEAFSRYALNRLHDWETDGFRRVHEMLLSRMEGYRETVTVDHAGSRWTGLFAGLDDRGSLILSAGGGRTRLLDIVDAVEIADPAESAA